MEMVNLLVLGTIISHIVFGFLVVVVIARNSDWAKDIFDFLKTHVILLGFIVTLLAVLGSLLLEYGVGYPPCELCWWQRIFLFPQAVIFLIALIKKDRNVFQYVVPLSAITVLISLYHAYIQLGGSVSVLPCTAEGAACAAVYILEYGYITIPTMSLTIALYVLMLAAVNKISRN